ncbi:MAG: ABC transporter ATP-binding protein [Proteobacteria bacterium]|nr:ABC transporter ATP-binding protein [Pseudomonadota bacterium]
MNGLDPEAPQIEDEEDPPVPSPSKEERAKASQSLRRLIRMSLVHWQKLVIVVLLATVFAASRFIRAWVFKPLLDEILVPAANNTLEIEAVEARIWQIGILVFGTLVITPIAMFFRNYLANWVVSKVRKSVDLQVAQKFLKAPLRVHRRGSSGDLLARALTDARLACDALLFMYRDVINSVVMLVAGLITMLATSWQLALLSMTTVLPSLFVLRFFGRRIQKQTRRRQETQGDLSQRLIAILSGIKVIKAFRGHEVELSAFDRETEKYFKRHMKVIKNRVLAKTSTEALNQFVGALILGVGAYLTYQELWEVTIGTLATFALILVTSYKPVKTLTMSYTSLVEAMSSGERLFKVLDMQEDPPDRPDAEPMLGLEKNIRFRDVRFDYGEDEILRGVDLEVRSGEVIAIVGRTGTGKSTLMDLLLRFHDPTSGSVEIDGVDLRDLQRNSFLDHVAVVTQEPFLFDETIEENIHYGRLDASPEEVRAAARAASAHDFIEELPLGYQTPVGEFGLRLSGGQRQRITIARAILCNPAILVFDEATSALDAKTERAVQLAIDSLRGQRTIFIVAHRLTTIRHADRIVVLDQGRVAEVGDHDTLMNSNGLYCELIGLNELAAV